MKFTCGDCVKVIKDTDKLHEGMTASIVRECKDNVSYWVYAFENNRYQGYFYVSNCDDAFILQEKEKVSYEELRKYARGEITHAGLLHYHSLPCAFYSDETYSYTPDDIYRFLLKYSKKELKPNEIEKWFTFVVYNVYGCFNTVDFLFEKPKNKEEEIIYSLFNDMDVTLACSSEYEECRYFEVEEWIKQILPLVKEK